MNIRTATPLVLSILLIAVICLLLLYMVTHQNIWINPIANFDIIFASIHLAWILIESTTSKDEINKRNKISDYGNCELYAIGQGAVFLSALWFTSAWKSPNLFHLFGFILFFAGIAYRLWLLKPWGNIILILSGKLSSIKLLKLDPTAVSGIRHTLA